MGCHGALEATGVLRRRTDLAEVDTCIAHSLYSRAEEERAQAPDVYNEISEAKIKFRSSQLRGFSTCTDM
jgi:hypothetical protein